jgi:hypothetical protein
MRKAFKIIIFTFLPVYMLAQEVHQKAIEYVYPYSLKGVFSFGNTCGYLSYSEKGNNNTDLYILELLEDDLTTKNRQFFAVNGDARFQQVLTNRNGVSKIVFYNSSLNQMQWAQINEQGDYEKIITYNFNVPQNTNLGTPTNITLAENGAMYFNYGFVTYNDIESKKRVMTSKGYMLMGLSSDGTELFNNKVATTNKDEHLQVDRITAGAFGIGVTNSKRNYKLQEFNNSITFFDNNGTKTGQYNFGTEVYDSYPMLFKSNANSIFVVGYLYEGKWFKANQSTGIYFQEIDASGAETSFKSYTWNEVGENMGERTGDNMLFSAKTKMMFHDIKKTPTGYELIAEAFNTSSGVSTAEFFINLEDNSGKSAITTFDLYVINITDAGAFAGISVINKPQHDVQLSGYAGGRRMEEFAAQWKDQHVFGFINRSDSELKYWQTENDVPTLTSVSITDGTILSKHALTIELMPEETNQVNEDFIASSKLLSGLQSFENKIQDIEAQVEVANNAFITSISGIEHRLGYNPNYGMICDYKGNVYSYLLDKNHYRLYVVGITE